MRRGLENASHRCVGYIEWDKYARKSYEAIFDTAGEWTAHDVTTIDARSIPGADIWTFGFPCQDLSVAGRQAGFSGQRSSLFFTVIDLIRNTEERNRPEWLIAENVMGLFSSNRGYDFLAAQIALDEIGYDVEWEVFNATQFGIPQNRQRVFIVGHSRSRGGRKVFPLGEDAVETTGKPGNVCGQNEVIGFETAFGNSNGSPVFTDVMRCLDGTQSKGVLVSHNRKDGVGGELDAAHTLSASDWRGLNRNQTQNDVVINMDARGDISQSNTVATLRANSHGNHPMIPVVRNHGEWSERETAQCLDANYWKGIDNHGDRTAVAIQKVGHLASDSGQTGSVYSVDGISPTVLNQHGNAVTKISAETRIRKLTPLECWRLMGRTDADFHAARDAGVSDTQLYKQAGNSLIPQIAEAIGRAIL
jgi:DNA (cytosine-5)-methyltransferase 1